MSARRENACGGSVSSTERISLENRCFLIWIACMSGLPACLVCLHVWFAFMSGLPSCHVCLHVWFAFMSGLP